MSVVFLPKTHNQFYHEEKHQLIPNRGVSHKGLDQYSSKLTKLPKTIKSEKLSYSKRALRDMTKCNIFQDGTLEQKKGHEAKTKEI